MRVGFLGLGIMGKQMVKQMLRNGVEVTVWNRSASKCHELISAGARAAATPAEVVGSCDVTHAMLSDPTASEAVVFGPHGVLSAIGDRRGYIDHSTIDEATGLRISEAVTAKGARFLAAPVSGGWRDAAKGELLFICGGDGSLYEESRATGAGMATMGHKHWLVGSPTDAARAKLMLQIMMGSMIGALAETMALASRAGLDESQVLDMFNSSAMANPICAAKGKLMMEAAYTPANFQVHPCRSRPYRV
jgi:glyoxylate/succinic semialdehyde reductase